MADVSRGRGGNELIPGHTDEFRGFAGIKHIIEPTGFGFGLGMQAKIAGELQAEMLFTDPNLSAVVPREVITLIQVVWLTACVAPGQHVWADRFAAHNTVRHDGGLITIHKGAHSKDIATLTGAESALYDHSALAICTAARQRAACGRATMAKGVVAAGIHTSLR